MKKLSDEILNKYIDGELSSDEFSEVNEILQSSDEDRIRLAALKAVHKNLKGIKGYKVSSDFTLMLMGKIRSTSKKKKEDKRLFTVISSIFISLSLIFIGYAFYLVLPEAASSNNVNQNVDSYLNSFVKALSSFANLLNSQNVSIIGFVFSIIVLISGYFFFESHKETKKRIQKLP